MELAKIEQGDIWGPFAIEHLGSIIQRTGFKKQITETHMQKDEIEGPKYYPTTVFSIVYPGAGIQFGVP